MKKIILKSVCLKISLFQSLIEELHQLIGRFQMCMVTPDESLKVTKLTEYFAEIDERAEFARRLRLLYIRHHTLIKRFINAVIIIDF